jgi:DNA repair photolyase
MFLEPDSSQFGEYIKLKRPMQWGGLSDQFDEFERRQGVTLELLRFFRQIEYPICFSTKATWWAFDSRYRECFDGYPWFNVKFSIITLDEDKAAKVEKGVPSPNERLAAMAEASKWVGGGTTLRLRPFIIGMSNPSHVELIYRAAEAGASAVSTEFFCLEQRSRGGKETRYPIISEACGFDVVEYYRRYSTGSGYLRLNRNVKRPFINEMEAACKDTGLRFYVSDAHFKERCHNGSCCGLPSNWNYTRGQNCEALMIAKQKGQVAWSDIEPDLSYAKGFLWGTAQGYNASSSEKRASFDGFTMYDYLHYTWNHPNSGQSPYKMFEGILKPERLDTSGDVVYVYDQSRA